MILTGDMTSAERVDYMISVLRAFGAGKAVECKSHGTGRPSSWRIITEPIWDWNTNDYRVKPEELYVPWDAIDEVPFGALVREKGSSGAVAMITGAHIATSLASLRVTVGMHTIDAVSLMERFVMMAAHGSHSAGSPCGKLSNAK